MKNIKKKGSPKPYMMILINLSKFQRVKRLNINYKKWVIELKKVSALCSLKKNFYLGSFTMKR